MAELIKKIYWLFSVQFGLDARRLGRSIKGIPRYVVGWFQFRRLYKGKMNFQPCLYDWYEEGGATKNEYFLQDLYVARKIHAAKPEKHVDIGSRIDGFVAHVASFREVEVFDIRPVTSEIPGIVFRQANLMDSPAEFSEYCDSLSCLHALEHFGLGRYGDPIDPYGYEAGLRNMVKVLRSGGLFYLSVPIGEQRVEFNAHRVFSPALVVRLATAHGLSLREFAWIGPGRKVIQSTDPEQDMAQLEKARYALGIFTFYKT